MLVNLQTRYIYTYIEDGKIHIHNIIEIPFYSLRFYQPFIHIGQNMFAYLKQKSSLQKMKNTACDISHWIDAHL